MSAKIIWLASYPKSGNTLLRSILVSLFFTDDGIFSLNKISNIGQFEETSRIKNNLSLFGNIPKEKINRENLFKNILKLQSKECLNLKDDKLIFFKTHSGLFNVYGYPFTNKLYTKGIIYIVRDPRDVCISWSRHSGKSIDNSIKFMINDNQGLHWNETEFEDYFTDEHRPMSYVSSWDRHVKSWSIHNWDVPMKIIKYEDLVYSKKKIITELIDFFEVNYNIKIKNKNEKVVNIINSTTFEKMKEDEKNYGFNESNQNSVFFSVGEKNQWRNMLNKSQITNLEKKFGKTMNRFNYKTST